MIKIVIHAVVLHVQKKFEIEPNKLKFLEKTVQLDLLVVGRKEGGGELGYLAIGECKRGLPEEDVKQLVVYELNNDRKPVYGLCYTGTRFCLVKYHQQNPDKQHKIFEI